MSDRTKSRHRLGITCAVFLGLIAGYGLVLSPAEAAAPTKSGCTSSTGASWDQNLSADCRFTDLAEFGGTAQRDNHTGLVWSTPLSVDRDWNGARLACITLNSGPTGSSSITLG